MPMYPYELYLRKPSFWRELWDSILAFSSHHRESVSPNWQEFRIQATVQNQRRLMDLAAKRKTRLKRYETGHYRAVYLKTKTEKLREWLDQQEKGQRQVQSPGRYWKVLDQDFVSQVN